MRLSTSTNLYNFDRSVPYQLSMEDAMRVCRDAGYSFLDANFCGMSRLGKKEAPMTLDDWDERVRSWKALADRTGINFRQAHAFFSVKGSITADALPDGEFGEEMMRRSVLAAEVLGVEWMVVHPVNILTDGHNDPEASFRYNLEYYGKWAEFFHAHHVGMAIENMLCGGRHNNVWADIDRLCALVDAIGRDNVGVCVDTGHANISGYKAADAIRKVGHRLRATHINDNHANGVDEHVAPYMGTIDWSDVMNALREIDYAQDFSFEIQNLTSCYPAALQPEMIRFSYRLGNYLLANEGDIG